MASPRKGFAAYRAAAARAPTLRQVEDYAEADALVPVDLARTVLDWIQTGVAYDRPTDAGDTETVQCPPGRWSPDEARFSLVNDTGPDIAAQQIKEVVSRRAYLACLKAVAPVVSTPAPVAKRTRKRTKVHDWAWIERKVESLYRECPKIRGLAGRLRVAASEEGRSAPNRSDHTLRAIIKKVVKRAGTGGPASN